MQTPVRSVLDLQFHVKLHAAYVLWLNCGGLAKLMQNGKGFAHLPLRKGEVRHNSAVSCVDSAKTVCYLAEMRFWD